jgi:hypothetical protein
LSLKGGLMSFSLVLKLNVQLFPYLTFLKQGILTEGEGSVQLTPSLT